MAVVAGTVTLLVAFLGFEPRNALLHGARRGGQGLARTITQGVRSMFVDSYRVFRVPTFVLLLLGEMVMVVGGSGAGFQVVYFQVGPLLAFHFSPLLRPHQSVFRAGFQVVYFQVGPFRSSTPVPPCCGHINA